MDEAGGAGSSHPMHRHALSWVRWRHAPICSWDNALRPHGVFRMLNHGVDILWGAAGQKKPDFSALVPLIDFNHKPYTTFFCIQYYYTYEFTVTPSVWNTAVFLKHDSLLPTQCAAVKKTKEMNVESKPSERINKQSLWLLSNNLQVKAYKTQHAVFKKLFLSMTSPQMSHLCFYASLSDSCRLGLQRMCEIPAPQQGC